MDSINKKTLSERDICTKSLPKNKLANFIM